MGWLFGSTGWGNADKSMSHYHNPRAAQRDKLAKARKDLARISKRDRRESADYHKANKRVAKLEKEIRGSWWW